MNSGPIEVGFPNCLMSFFRLNWFSFGLSMVCSIHLFVCSESVAQTTPLSSSLAIIWTAQGVQQNIKNWTHSDFMHLKWATRMEKDPQSGKILKWVGVLISQFLDTALETLPIESRAQVDLVILKNRLGQSAFIPRAMIVKYPFMFAFQHNGSEGRKTAQETQQDETIHSVVPWSSKPKVLMEDVPIESYYMSDITQVEFTSYKDQFSNFFLKRRTDPSAIRGEKLFVQNCVSCHQVKQSPVETSFVVLIQKMKLLGGDESFPSKGHLSVSSEFSNKLNSRDRRSIMRYLEAYQLEHPVTVSTGGSVSHVAP